MSTSKTTPASTGAASASAFTDHELTLILGSSGSGKTSLVRNLLSASRYKLTYIVNCNDKSDYRKAKELKIKYLDWESCLESRLKKCNIVFEDLITLQQKKTSVIKKIVHFLLRRKYIHMFLVAHEIRNSGLYSLLEHANTVYMTSGFQNAKLLRDFSNMRPVKGLDPEAFMKKKFHYLKINMSDMTFRIFDDQLQDATQSLGMSLASKRSAVEAALKCFPNPAPLLVIFDLIFKNLEPDLLTTNDLCLLVRDADGKTKKISIVDFLVSLRSSEKPAKELKKLKLALDKQFVIPKVFVTNRHMRKKAPTSE